MAMAGVDLPTLLKELMGHSTITTTILSRITVTDTLKNIGKGLGSAAPEWGYSWYAGI